MATAAAQGSEVNAMVIHNRKVLRPPPASVTRWNVEVSEFLGLGTKGFAIFVAPKGVQWTVTNRGDGGYTNWCFAGHFDRDGSTVTFH
mmetsp:Transcript_72162/g.209005  ORF Transcript_72162/g.209005 Transcript_72162/m.209005 type:complete len:88 (+) Transcript_72162:373-636(+)